MKMKKTPLYEKHLALKARIIDFGGWAMPVQYTGVIEEHQKTRSAAGLFDICHMGEIEVRGPQAFTFLQYALTRDLRNQEEGQIRLSALLNEQGGIIDDLTVYKFAPDHYLLVTNAATKDRDWQRLNILAEEKEMDCQLQDVSEATGKLDLQGPSAERILQPLTECDLSKIRYYHFAEVSFEGSLVIVSRSGYTGEDGFEIYAPAEKVGGIWDKLLAAGATFGLRPAGLGARDTLRLEAGMMLNGQDMSESVSPLEVPYGWLVDWKKDFAGKEALEVIKKQGVAKKLAGFVVTGRGIARHGYKVFNRGREIGSVTSGTFSPSLNKAVGLAFIDAAFSEPKTEIEVAIRDTVSAAIIVPLPFYKRKKILD